MTEAEDIHIQRMDLSRVPTPETDSIVDDEDYIKRNELFEALKAYDICENKPYNAPFEIAENTSDKDYISCHLPIPILKIEGTILNKTSKSNPIKKVPPQHIWAMPEAAEWCK